ncbi:hypothetical protein Hte_002875 [Hypoxylon texense]
MTTEPASPKRRHILSSINPDYRSESPKMEHPRASSEEVPPQEPQPDSEPAAAEGATETREKKRTSRFRFKSKKSSHSHRDRDRDREDRDDEESSHRHRRHRHHHHHHSSHHRHKRRRTRSRSPTPPNPFEPPPLGSDAAFRESLFDAMADDEGAAYWENVYGQPIHIYPQTRPSGTANAADAGEEEKEAACLERMDDNEYAAFVRQKMWEKTHQGLLEERARREARRKKRDEEQAEAARLTREMERSLRRGEARRRRKGWKERFDEYVQAWGAWDGAPEGMAWPVRSGRREDVDAAAVKDFFVLGIDAEDIGEAEFLAKLKEERVRWHPDKIQQKLGGKVDEAIMRDVTAVFQIVDKLWSDTRAKK